MKRKAQKNVETVQKTIVVLGVFLFLSSQVPSSPPDFRQPLDGIGPDAPAMDSVASTSITGKTLASGTGPGRTG